MSLIEAGGPDVDSVGQQGNSFDAFPAGKKNSVFQQLAANPFSAPCFFQHEILQNGCGSAFGRTDGEKKADHSDHSPFVTNREYLSPEGIAEDKTQPRRLFPGIGFKISLLIEKKTQ